MANYKRELNLICLPLERKYRSHIEIIALILEAATDKGAALYSLMKRANINYVQLKKYLQSLIKIGFIDTKIENGKVSFKVSEKGFAFLAQYNILRDMLLGAYTGNKSIVVTQVEKLSKMPQWVVIPIHKKS